jgi:hypothetical protein
MLKKAFVLLTKRIARGKITIMLILSHFDALNAPAMAPVSRLWLFFNRKSGCSSTEKTAKKQRRTACDLAVISATESLPTQHFRGKCDVARC